MEQSRRLSILYNPMFRVTSTLLWVLVGPLFFGVIILAVLRIDFTTAFLFYVEHRYIAVYIEIISAGLLPLLFSLICKDDLTLYGLGRKGFVSSILLSAMYVTSVYGLSFLSTGHLIEFGTFSFHLKFLWTFWYAALGVFAYGPLEVFVVVWLITNTDRIFKGKSSTISIGLIVTIIIWSLLHIISAGAGIGDALGLALRFFFLGLIYKYTENSIGPMIAWSLVNGIIFSYALILLS